jgi:hypothetical protein
MLTEEQRRKYAEDGCLLVSGLIPAEIAAGADAAIWRALGGDPNDPASWASLNHAPMASEDPAVLACYTPELLTAAAQLSDDDPDVFRPPSRAFSLNVFPREGVWEWPDPHIDHAIKEHGHKTFPRAFRICAMIYLHDIVPHGGGTVVWPGSHRRIEALAKSDPDRYAMMWALNQDLGRIDLGAPVELTPRQGDVLFFHCLCAHAGSRNTSGRPRFAFNTKW